MTTNSQGSRQSNRAGDSTVVDTTTTPAASSTGVGSVAVFDRDVDSTTTTSNRSSASVLDERGPAEVRSGGSAIGWVIGVIVLIILAYFLLQMIF